jgi:hypothetical protein
VLILIEADVVRHDERIQLAARHGIDLGVPRRTTVDTRRGRVDAMLHPLGMADTCLTCLAAFALFGATLAASKRIILLLAQNHHLCHLVSFRSANKLTIA